MAAAVHHHGATVEGSGQCRTCAAAAVPRQPGPSMAAPAVTLDMKNLAASEQESGDSSDSDQDSDNKPKVES